ncbi:MAG: GNAT family N-acetyltransferase, partial [Clostridia bacterium]|nr:GNAT family N-acetyltransferase [Clostridia bacterium]
MNIENFELRHLDGVEKIEKVCFAHPWSRADLQNQINLETSHFLVATVDGEVAGYMGLQIFGGEGYVTNVAVLPEYRKQGIAEALVRA